MALIVQKFGGTSVADKDRVKHVAKIAASEYKKGNDVVMVVSAQGHTTDELIQKAKEISDKVPKRELDALMATGEQASAALMVMALHGLGCPGVSLTGWQAGVSTDNTHGNARIRDIDVSRLKEELKEGRIPVVAGFQGLDDHGDITTIGRGGSDTTAVALAAALDADLCKIYTDVDGIYSADPRDVPRAVKLYEIDYDEMLELASLGAKVLHNRAVEMAKRYGVRLAVLSSFQDKPGTRVREVTMEQKCISSVARDVDVAIVYIRDISADEGKVSRLLTLLADKKINVDMIHFGDARVGVGDLRFTIARGSLGTVTDVLYENRAELGYADFSVDEGVCKVSAVGLGMASSPGVAASILEALYHAGIQIRSMATSEIKVSLLVDEGEGVKAANVIHDLFF